MPTYYVPKRLVPDYNFRRLKNLAGLLYLMGVITAEESLELARKRIHKGTRPTTFLCRLARQAREAGYRV